MRFWNNDAERFPCLPVVLLFAGLLLSTACAGPGEVSDSDSARAGHPDAVNGEMPSVSEEDYRRAASLLNSELHSMVLRSNIQPEWMDGERFWYGTRTDNGFRFYRVDAAVAERGEAFDHERLADSLTSEMDRSVTPGDLPFRSFEYLEDETVIDFEADGKRWECDIEEYVCGESGRPVRPDESVLSPDRQWAAFIRDHNIWVRDMESGEEHELTEGGEHRYGFGTNSQGWFRSDRPVLHWSPDSRKIATYRLEEREVSEMHLLETSQDRPMLDSWPYALPGDTLVPMHERVVLDVASRSKIWLDAEPSHQRTSNCCGLERDGQWADITWSEDASRMAYVTTSRDYRQVDLYIADTETGDVRHVYGEQADTFFESNLTSRGKPNWRVLFERDQFIWFSRRDEWGHLYLYDLETGGQIGQMTTGDWNVVDVLHVDEPGATVHFTAVGLESDRDPYRKHLYSIEFSGLSDPGDRPEDAFVSPPELLSPEDANHLISASPSGLFYLDEYSSFHEPSVTVLRDAEGSEVMTVEEADTGPLEETDWRMPEPFQVKARDGETDLYGLMYKPSDFDPDARYPVVINIYPGPQIGSVGTRSFSPTRRGQTHALAELGFIVIQLDALGTPLRSKSFHTAWYGDMVDNGIEDQIAAVSQLAERHTWLDAERLGMYGHSGGGYATMSALLRFPGVFSAGVASAGNMDNRGYTYYWGEKYQGQRVTENDRDSFSDQAIWKKAGELEDHLLLTYGTVDDNVHPNMTLLLIDELIRENKDFDLIVMPNRNHGYANEAYHVRRTWDYFVRHLMHAKPPREFPLGN